MSYTTIQRPAKERAAAVVYGTLVALRLADQDDAARYLMSQLSPELLDQLNDLAERDVERGVANALRAHVEAAGNMTLTFQYAPGREPAQARDLRVVGDQDEPTWEQRTKAALVRVLPRITLSTFTQAEAFGALVHRVSEACERDDVEPVEVLQRLGHGRLTAAARVDDPAAYLTAKVRDWYPDDEENDQ